LPTARVFTASTGVIGEPLPHERIIDSLETLSAGLAPEGIEQAARAIMTTETFAKGAMTEIIVEGQPIRIAGIAKGS
ncbi:bifunctional ornithine acetyltransferase/N-acetylglutamate synthase, partial [Klebsiella quasipneumoniae]|uniref:bifunctional ornithine acetyltransferase/N-acetylglutamate synthase n=1 Tax=Klebsiella quasipneumoniae TaxID=1463165 RepID=UPI0027315C49